MHKFCVVKYNFSLLIDDLGSTLIAAIVQHNRFVSIVNVGDSRAVACDRDGIARPLSIDHKPTNVSVVSRFR
jgi:protein phosphatase 1L